MFALYIYTWGNGLDQARWSLVAAELRLTRPSGAEDLPNVAVTGMALRDGEEIEGTCVVRDRDETGLPRPLSVPGTCPKAAHMLRN